MKTLNGGMECMALLGVYAALGASDAYDTYGVPRWVCHPRPLWRA